MAFIEFGCRPTIIGGLPHKDPPEACAVVARHLKDIPAWPQLPNRGFSENMYVQYGGGFPGIVTRGEESKIFVDTSQDLTQPLAEFYDAYFRNDADRFAINRDSAAGLYAFLSQSGLSPLAVKGQVTGPVTWGLMVTDEKGKAIIYNDLLSDAVPKLLRMKASWQEKVLRQISKNTIIFIDEPYMSAFGSVGVMLSEDKIISLLEEVFGGITGLKGVHCCGNTDWSVLLKTSLDILNFDAYNYAESLSLYPAEVKRFLDRNGTIAWGIVPNEAALLDKETVVSLKDRLEDAMAPFTRKGVPFKQLIAQGLITPNCGLSGLPSGEKAEQAIELLTALSKKIRERYL